MKNYKLIFWWLSILTFITVLALLFSCYIVFYKDIVIESKFVPVMTIIITLAAIMFSFSAINIYTVFNANIDNEKGRIDKLFEDISKSKDVDTTLKTRIESIESKLDNHEKTIITLDSKIIWSSTNNIFKKYESIVKLEKEYNELKSSVDKNKYKQERLNDVLYYYKEHKGTLAECDPDFLQNIHKFLLATGCIKE